MKLRLNARAQETVEQLFRSLEEFERYLNGNTCWMFLQEHRKYINGKEIVFSPSTVLLSGKIKLVLSPPVITSDGGEDLQYHCRILTVLQPNRSDRADALAGKEVTEEIQIEFDTPARTPPPPTSAITVPKVTEEQVPETSVAMKEEAEVEGKPAKPSTAQGEDRQKFLIAPLCQKCGSKLVPMRGQYCQSCGVTLPPELAVHREVIVVIRKADYDKLADYLKQAINAAWSQVRHGRKIGWKITSQGQAIFLLSVENEYEASTVSEEQKLSTILEETGAGRLTTDRYELREIHKMMEKQPA